MKRLFVVLFVMVSCSLIAQNTNSNKFRQLYNELPTPNSYRTASGAPGEDYWQQKVDYKMDIKIDDEKARLLGYEKIKYHNNSPHTLKYLWVQLDQNVRSHTSDKYKIQQRRISDKSSIRSFEKVDGLGFDGGHNIESVTSNGRKLKYTINKTMMRVDLPTPLMSGQTFDFDIKWWYNINNTKETRGRSGYEPFADGNNVYCIAQFFPRLCKYYDAEGWQNKQFLGNGEFTLEFGDYDVNITVPADHVVASTGTLQNPNDVLTAKQKERLREAKNEFDQPVMIVTLDEAKENAKSNSRSTKTWKFSAENVRDFAFATSRRFIWDAMNTKLPNGSQAMAQSMYVPEGYNLWKKYSTKTVAHTLKWYSHYTIDYPYPTAWSIDGSMGMEYPMICFNYGRCEPDGTYSQRTKYGHIGVIIHEVGHNYFPMIINSDERQWTWMDEGLNTFVQFLTEQHFERNYPHRRGPANNERILKYMSGDKATISPIMTNSESIWQFGNNAYGKPATAFNILRETVMGRELFDYAFKEYANRWKFKTPTPADFFRSMEDASAVDLDWFWRAWFFTTDNVDISLNVQDLGKLGASPSDNYVPKKKTITQIRNEKAIAQTYREKDNTLTDYYTNYDASRPDVIDQKEFENYKANLTADQKALLNKYAYQLSFENIGGIPMPVIFKVTYTDGTDEIRRIPAEIWKMDDKTVYKVLVTDKVVKSIELDPYEETSDVDRSNNFYPTPEVGDRFEAFKKKRKRGENGMQRAKRAEALLRGN